MPILRGRPRLRRAAVSVSATAILLAALANRFGLPVGVDQWGLAVAVAGLVVVLVQWGLSYVASPAPGSEPLTSQGLEDAAWRLASAQREQLGRHEVWIEAGTALALPVSWSATTRTRAVTDPLAVAFGAGDAGQLADAAGFFVGIAPRRLVFLGEGGAGKSTLALHLVLDLIIRRTAADPVPFLLSVRDWDPQHPLTSWIAERLSSRWDWLARPVTAPGGQTRTLAAQLLAAELLLPVVVDLDEMALGNRGDAIAAINKYLERDRQIIIMCRTAEFAAACGAGGRIKRTPVVEIATLKKSDVMKYLRYDAGQPTNRWNGIDAHLSVDGTALMEALSTPLMVWLTRVVYRDAQRDPSELITASWAGTAAGIKQHLLKSLVPSVYDRPRWYRPFDTPAKRQTWLENLALWLTTNNTRDLAWWRLRDTIPKAQLRYAIGLISSLFSGSIVGLTVGSAYGPRLAAVTGILFGVIFGLINGISIPRPSTPAMFGRASTQPVGASILPASLVAITYGVIGGTATWYVFGSTGAWVGLLITIGAGIAVGVPTVLTTVSQDRRSVSPTLVLRNDRRVALVNAVLATGLVTIAAGLTILLTMPVAVSPIQSLTIALSIGAATGFTVILRTHWGEFCLTRLILALRGQTPIRLISFLENAQKRELLRQEGGTYQFRHADLHDHLTSSARTR